MTDAEIAELRAGLEGVTPGPWKWWTSCSWRRLSSEHRGYSKDGGVICPTVSQSDGHPDIIASQEDMDHIARCSPDKIAALLARLDAAEGGWQDIATAPPMSRVLVAGWQKPRHGVVGYWWFYEDETTNAGRPFEHTNATMWRPWPAPPVPLSLPKAGG